MVKTYRDTACLRVCVWSVSAVSGLKYPDSDAHCLRTLRWNRVLDEGAPDRATSSHVCRRRLVPVIHHLFTSTRLPPSDDT